MGYDSGCVKLLSLEIEYVKAFSYTLAEDNCKLTIIKVDFYFIISFGKFFISSITSNVVSVKIITGLELI
jgi:hypothetical protein